MGNLTFDWQIGEYMVYCRSRQLREKTMNSYEQALRLFERWCVEQMKIETVDKVTENTMRRYMTGWGNNKPTACAAGEGNNSSGATADAPTFTRRIGGNAANLLSV